MSDKEIYQMVILQALESPRGIVVRSSDRSLFRSKLYSARQTIGEEAMILQIIFLSSGDIAIVKGKPKIKTEELEKALQELFEE